MARPLRLHAPGILCHVTSRGNARQQIFVDDQDYERFLEILSNAATRFGVSCIGYCLMQNHTHLLLRPQDVPISRLMQQLNSTYCQWFNRRHDRVGHVLQGRFHCRLVDNDVYFLRVLRYVVRNPVTAGYVHDPADWPWSSHRVTAGLDATPTFLNVEDIWRVFGPTDDAMAHEQFRIFVESDADDRGTFAALLVGSPNFARRLEPRLHPHRDVEDFVYAERLAARPPLSLLLPEYLEGSAINVAVGEAFLRHAYTLREIGQRLNRPTATIWRWVQRSAVSESAQPSVMRRIVIERGKNEKIEI
jgi:putative transposase